MKPPQIGDVIKQNYGAQFPNANVQDMGGCMLCFLFNCCCCIFMVKKFKTFLAKGFILVNTRSEKVLGIKYRPMEDTIKAMADALI
jgi:hypothetical protein